MTNKKQKQLAFDLLIDFFSLKRAHVLDKEELKILSSLKLSHRYSNSYLGKLYLKYYYSSMIVTAFNHFDRGDFLELGCGTGTQVIYANKIGFNSALGIDLFKDRIDIANKRARFYNVDYSAKFEVNDFWKFTADKKFNAVYSMFAFELFGGSVTKTCDHLIGICSKKTTIILDMGNVSRLHKKRYFNKLVDCLRKEGFEVRIEILTPFLVGTWVAKTLGNFKLWPYFRAVRLIIKK
jgi:SAM-dependent methyltransferase